ncbi:MAG: FHA domain-containing protein [Woeseiaceae bacterium]|nr:FHA domain-containing protein [Woeseiaceae bacterium]
MTRLAIHINDAGITLLDQNRIIYREPGFAWLGDDSLETGNAAFARARIDPRRIQHHYWSELHTEPLRDSRFSHLSAADLVSRQLEQIWAAAGSGVTEIFVAVPPYIEQSQLGLFLGIAGELKIPVAAMVDAPVAATRREYRNAVPVHIDIGLHCATLSRMSQQGAARAERSHVLDSCGVYALFDGWLNTVAEAFVQQSRFDPLHTAETEQLVVDRLAGWLTEAARGDHVDMEIDYSGTSYAASVESLALIGAAAPIYQQLSSRLRAIIRAEETPAIQVTDRVSRLPGLTELLKSTVGGEVFVLEPGATARGALARCRASTGDAGGITLIRQLPWDQAAVEVEIPEDERADAGAPTHLLYGYTAYAIGNSALILGSQEGEESRHVTLASDMPGVSRRHCSLVKKNGQCILEDHSRYGTFLNGHRIDGSSVLQVGDIVRVGSPGYEFRLIRTDDG